MKNQLWSLKVLGKILFGCVVFAVGFNLFLEPNGLNAGGISGLAMVLTTLTGFGTVGLITAVVNLPLFALAGARLGKGFVVQSLVGMLFASVLIDLFALLPRPATEPLMGALYGGAMCGFGLGMVFTTGGSTGGSDIIVRLLKMRWKNVPIGTINMFFDLAVAVLTGLVFRDISRALYSGVAIFIAGQVIDAVVYRFDYSRVALIVSRSYEAVAEGITRELSRGVTFLKGEGCYSHRDTKVILTAVKRQQLAELKELVARIDPQAFVIVQEAHQVLGDGFSRYSRDAL